MRIRRGGPADAPVMLAMMDGAVEWLVRNGRSGQWGEDPWSADPKRVERIEGIAASDAIWVAEVEGRPADVMATSPTPPSYVMAAGEPELYITLLVTDRAFAGFGVGGALIARSRDEARRPVRVSCGLVVDGGLGQRPGSPLKLHRPEETDQGDAHGPGDGLVAAVADGVTHQQAAQGLDGGGERLVLGEPAQDGRHRVGGHEAAAEEGVGTEYTRKAPWRLGSGSKSGWAMWSP